ncbi:hypothetical protein V2T44_16345 [Serratia ficaria]|uniref:Uncharacterized protein n=1 Tax=Serratia ficaria TaxID=61651 RepID=A0A240BZ96_SERFI|nr:MULTISPECIES: hypothetical protein [Serratia]MEE4484509.1 hypothetical protein [Serratia ficaria]REF45009.1 hypothetical protein C7332_3330 [Serratia ficaria]CAI0734555.1 Uncharacterised protein [Serratia ficaria]CAI0768432.1 Uncharacterised protein [Serratia ficaria]CAI0848379.1 Uncharacterised protein [Serratia ficaria]
MIKRIGPLLTLVVPSSAPAALALTGAVGTAAADRGIITIMAEAENNHLN